MSGSPHCSLNLRPHYFVTQHDGIHIIYTPVSPRSPFHHSPVDLHWKPLGLTRHLSSPMDSWIKLWVLWRPNQVGCELCLSSPPLLTQRENLLDKEQLACDLERLSWKRPAIRELNHRSKEGMMPGMLILTTSHKIREINKWLYTSIPVCCL